MDAILVGRKKYSLDMPSNFFSHPSAMVSHFFLFFWISYIMTNNTLSVFPHVFSSSSQFKAIFHGFISYNKIEDVLVVVVYFNRFHYYLGSCFHRVAMSVPLSPFHVFLGLSLDLRSHDQFKASHWSTLHHYQT